jgi:uncharacterized protein (DUF4415 family)
MRTKKNSGTKEWVDLDDAPELTEAFFNKAEVWHADTFVTTERNRGRPKSESPKEMISLRLDPDVLTKLRAGGPGWQSRVNGILRQVLDLDGQPIASVTRKSLRAPRPPSAHQPRKKAATVG